MADRDEPPVFEGVPLRGVRVFGDFAKRHAQCLVPGEHVYVEREPTNPVHSNAIKACDEYGSQFAYVAWEAADEISPWMDAGWFFETYVTDNVMCIIHACHVIVKLVPIKPMGEEETTEQERELEDV